MGTPGSKVRRKKKDEKQKQKERNALVTTNQRNDIQQIPNKPSSRNQIDQATIRQSNRISEAEKDFDVNTLPRQKTGSDEIIRAIDDVNKRISKSNTKRSKDYVDDSGVLPERSLEIENLVKEVKRKAKNHQDLDKKIEENNQRLSQYYSKLSIASLENLRKISSEIEKSNSTTSKNPKEQRKEQLAKELQKLEELENKKQIKLMEQDRLLAVQNMKISDAILISNSLNNFDSISVINDLQQGRKLKKLQNVKDLTRARYGHELTKIQPIDGLYDKHYQSEAKSIKDLFENDDDCEPIYDKVNDLQMVDVRPDADLIEVYKKCKKTKDLYSIDPEELKQIIQFVEKKEREHSSVSQECSYYLEGTEIYSTVKKAPAKNQTKFEKISDVSKPSQPIVAKQENIVKQIFEDLVLNYKMEQAATLPKAKNVHFSKNTEVQKVDFFPAFTDQPISSPKKSFSNSCLSGNDPMPNVTKFIETLERKNYDH